MTIREFRIEQKLSQPELATALDISVSSLRQYEYGKREPGAAVLERLKAVFGVDLNAPAAQEKPAKKTGPSAGRTAVIIQSPMGGEITAEEILARVGPVDKVYVRVDQNAAYWVKGDDSGAVNLW